MWTREVLRPYQRVWAQKHRLEHLRRLYAQGDRSRHVINGLGRASCGPNHKWCAWSQHRCLRTAFRPSRHHKDGLCDLCRECQDIIRRISAYVRATRGVTSASTLKKSKYEIAQME